MPEHRPHERWGPGRTPPWVGAEGWRPGRHMLRRIFGFILFLVLGGSLIGAVVATGLASLNGGERLAVVGVTLVAFVGFAFAARWMFTRTVAPVGELIDATRRLGEGETGVRVRSRGRGPMSAVAASFNRMAEGIEEDDERRRRLLADLSHELRNPLTVVRGEIEAVLDGLHRPDQLSNVIDEVDLMERLLDDLRLLALTEAGRLQLDREQSDIAHLVGDVVSSFSASLERHGITVRLDTDHAGEMWVDAHRLHQVLSNLISNSIQQMAGGGDLEISARQTDQALEIEIADSGPGIPEERLNHIFDRFVKGGDSVGTGLGLSIARDLVEAHDGTIEARNRPNGGAVFVVRLPTSGA